MNSKMVWEAIVQLTLFKGTKGMVNWLAYAYSVVFYLLLLELGYGIYMTLK